MIIDEESQLLKKLNKCKTRKCAKTYKEQIKEQKKIFKELDEESRLVKKINKCVTRKCGKIYKEQTKEEKKLYKEQDKKCTQKSSKAYYNCTVGLYDKSKYKILFDKWVKCAENKCCKKKKTLKS